MRNIKDLQQIAKEVRKETLDLALEHNHAHIGSAFSIVEILVALYYKIMKQEDKFVLSKGHGCLSWYCILRRMGYNPTISGHPDIDPDNGICCTTGSLGHGYPLAFGMAFARTIQNKPGKIFCLMGDGERQEGTTWETLSLMYQYRLQNLVVIVDYNELQSLGPLVTPLSPFAVANPTGINGHDFEELLDTISNENIIIAHTIKGKAISFMEKRPEWHSRIPRGELIEQAYKEIELSL